MKTLLEFTTRFGTVEACLEHLQEARWSEGAYCPHCGGDRIFHFKDGRRHKCGDCKHTFRIITGTIFSDSPIKMLPKWFAAIWIDTCHSKGISSVQLGKMIGVTQKTAWHMLQRIRHAAGQDQDGMMGVIVEADETHIGGKEKNKHASKRVAGTQGRSTKTKTVVFGMKERGGKTKAFRVDSATSKEITPHMIKNIALGSNVNEDEYRAYCSLDTFYGLSRVNHSTGKHVRYGTHTNSIESVWALVKRVYLGIHRHWSRKHTQRYIDSCVFRLNNRELESKDRVTHLIKCGLLVKLPHKELVA